MQIYGPAHLHGPQSVGSPHNPQVARPTGQVDSAPIQDELQISDAARLVDEVGSMADIRQDRVASIRAQIAEGTYDTPERLDLAVERLLDEIG